MIRLAIPLAILHHSFRSDSTGLARAAFTDWKLTVSMAISVADKPARA